jgi:hypothetical protein
LVKGIEPIATNHKYCATKTISMPSAMKGKKYKYCVFCGKKRAFGPWKLMRPNHGVCDSCIDRPNFTSLIEKWENEKATLDQIIQDATKDFQEDSA